MSAFRVVKFLSIGSYLLKTVEMKLNHPDYQDTINYQLNQEINARICEYFFCKLLKINNEDTNIKKASDLLLVKLQSTLTYLRKNVEIQLNQPDYKDTIHSLKIIKNK